MTITTDVENYPGFKDVIQGPWLMDQMKAQAESVGTKIINDIITECNFKSKPFELIGDSKSVYYGKTVIIEPGKYNEIELKLKKGADCKNIKTQDNNNLIGVGISLGLPSYLLNYNLRFSTKKLNFEYAADMYKVYKNQLQKIEDIENLQILGNQFTFGIGSHQNGYWNIFYGETQFLGSKTFTVLYVIDNTTYEYWGISRKQYGKVFSEDL